MVNTLFEPYATNKKKGTGLGLAIVKKIIEEHHGHVWAENDDAGGARIVMHLPLELEIKGTP
jgi:nitrogen fixation/metabolism regulation signal transduction histidine kinase